MRKLYDALLILISKIESDKLLHCLLCLIFASFIATSILKISTTAVTIISSIILTNIPIIGKEMFDKKSYGVFSVADIIWGEIGMTLGILLSLY